VPAVNEMTINLEATEAAITAEVFATYLSEGQSLSGVAKHLMAPRTPTPDGHRQWNRGTIHGILSHDCS
jgi:hypothetical protein